jgi:transglutaminase-like putative cysteine protease
MAMTHIDTDALREAVAYLKRALPEADLTRLDEEALTAFARHALTAREEAPWGASIPEDVFKLYLLFPRVNNEKLTFYHEEIASRLKPRLTGLSMREAALAVNLWCFEQATYRSTSERTAPPLTVMRAGFGRCGEESTLVVSAMRAAGIPARQCYVPRWAHCDDNHAWIEAYVDGSWHYMGACEPEPQLDSGWFTAAASRAMLVHTRAYGMPPEGERVEAVNGREYTVNRTDFYAPTALLRIRVLDHGEPKPGAAVLFELNNMAEFYPICEKRTGPDGCAELLTGLGSVRVRALDGEKSAWTVADLREAREYALDLKDATALEPAPRSFRLVPPAGTRIQPVPAPGPALDAHRERLKRAASNRQARLEGFRTGNPYADRAGGNVGEIASFLADGRYLESDKALLLDSLAEKDFYDVTQPVLEDALAGALPWKRALPESVWQQYLLCPRVASEELYPVRRALREALNGLRTPVEIWESLSKTVAVRELAPPAVFPDAISAFSNGFTSARGLDILFVQACRALGIPARLSPETGDKEYYKGGGFVPLIPGAAADAELTLTSGEPLKYAERFTLSRVESGRDRTLDFDSLVLAGAKTLPLRSGRYHLTAVTRQIDGTVDGVVIPFELLLGGALELRVSPPPDDTARRLFHAPLPPLKARALDGTPRHLPEPGEPALIAFLSPGEEPTEHFLMELNELKGEFEKRGIAVRLIVDEPSNAPAGIPGAEILSAVDAETLLEWHRVLHCGDLRKPFAAAVSGGGEGLCAFSNYSVGSVRALLRALDSAAPDQH